MAKDYMDLGSAPAEEDCAQVGSDDYSQRVRRECRIWIDQLKRTMNPTLRLATYTDSGHDAGTQYYVVCYYDNENEAEVEEMLRLESESPGKWDDAALAMLRLSSEHS
jgi:hypothetical protein